MNEANEKKATLFINSNGELLIRIRFRRNDFTTMDFIRTLPGRIYLRDTQCWIVPMRVSNILALTEYGFDVDDNLMQYVEQKEQKKETLVTTGIEGLQGTLRPFQSIGVSFIEEHRGRALVADEMGLGKTIQALAWMQLHRDIKPVIIVVPASLKLNWQREAELWLPHPDIEILSGTTPWHTSSDILIINYDILWHWLSELRRRKPQAIIADECHYFKNNKAKRTKAIKMLAKGIPNFVGLSGTPIYNYPVEIYNAWRIIDPLSCPEQWYYLRHFCNAKHNGFGWNFSGAGHIDELHQLLTTTIMIRRLKKDVLPDLPPKVYSFVPMELSNTVEYRKAEQDYIAFVRQQKGADAAVRASNAEAFAKTEGLKQLAVKGKLRQVITWIDDFLSVKEKLVVFTTHHFTMDAIMKEFGAYAVKMDGSCSTAARQAARDKFQNDPACKLFVGMIDVQGRPAGEGWTLTAASNVAFIELQWSPKTHDQAADRCHRIGQKDCVNVHYLLAKGTIEEKIAHLLDKKREIIDGTLDGGVTETGSMLREIMNEYAE